MTTPSLPRKVAAIGLTAVWPGSGHALLKRWWDVASWTLLALSIVLLGWLAIDAQSLGDLVDPNTIQRALIVNGALGAARLASLVDVVWTTRAHRSWIGGAVAAVALAVLVVPHVYAHRVGTETITLLESVFVSSPASTPQVLGVELDQEPPGTGTTTTTTFAEPVAGAASPSMPFGEQRSRLAVGEDGRLTVLLLGTDEAHNRTGFRTDSIMVVSIDPWTLSTAMFGIPRNWGGIPMPEEWPGPDIHPDMANTVYQYGWDHPEVFPDAEDPGAQVAKRVFGDLLDLEIDHFIKVSMEGFVAVIDAMGGLEVNVTFEVDNEFALPDEPGWVEVDLEQGVQTLDGLEAMGYARSRRTSNDYHRMGRQRCLVAAIAAQMTTADVLLRYHELARAIGDHVSTDIPLELVPSLIDLASLVNPHRISTVTFVPPLFVDGGDGLGHRKPHIARVRAAVLDGLSEEITGAEGVTDVGTACEL